MAVSLYFGLPGAGKTTMMVYLALKGIRSKRYSYIYCNVRIAVPGVTYIDNECIGKYNLTDCLILVDEATLFADSRDFKNFDKGKLTYFLEHRHYNADIVLFTQQWDGVDRKIRVITDRVFYVYKGKILGRWFTRCYPIPYGIIIPDPKKDSSEKLGEIVQGYAKPNILVRLFSPWLYRPRYYKYFDSWERPPLPSLPSRYNVSPLPKEKKKKIFSKRRPPAKLDLTTSTSAIKKLWKNLTQFFHNFLIARSTEAQTLPDEHPCDTSRRAGEQRVNQRPED